MTSKGMTIDVGVAIFRGAGDEQAHEDKAAHACRACAAVASLRRCINAEERGSRSHLKLVLTIIDLQCIELA